MLMRITMTVEISINMWTWQRTRIPISVWWVLGTGFIKISTRVRWSSKLLWPDSGKSWTSWPTAGHGKQLEQVALEDDFSKNENFIPVLFSTVELSIKPWVFQLTCSYFSLVGSGVDCPLGWDERVLPRSSPPPDLHGSLEAFSSPEARAENWGKGFCAASSQRTTPDRLDAVGWAALGIFLIFQNHQKTEKQLSSRLEEKSFSLAASVLAQEWKCSNPVLRWWSSLLVLHWECCRSFAIQDNLQLNVLPQVEEGRRVRLGWTVWNWISWWICSTNLKPRAGVRLSRWTSVSARTVGSGKFQVRKQLGSWNNSVFFYSDEILLNSMTCNHLSGIFSRNFERRYSVNYKFLHFLEIMNQGPSSFIS